MSSEFEQRSYSNKRFQTYVIAGLSLDPHSHVTKLNIAFIMEVMKEAQKRSYNAHFSYLLQ